MGILIVVVANVIEINFLFLILLVVMVICIIFVHGYFQETKVAVKQLDLVMKNPVFKKMGEVIDGVKMIQIFSRQKPFLKDASRLIDNSIKSNIFVWYTTVAYNFLIEVIGWIIISIVLLAGIKMIESPSQYSLAALFLLQIIDNLSWYVSNLINVQTSMISATRCLDLIEILSESPENTAADFEFIKGEPEDQEQGSQNIIR